MFKKQKTKDNRDQCVLLPWTLIQEKIIEYSLLNYGMKSIAITCYQRYPSKRLIRRWALMSLACVCWKWFEMVSKRITHFKFDTSSMEQLKRLEDILKGTDNKYRVIKRIESLVIFTPRKYRSLDYYQCKDIMGLIRDSTTITRIKCRVQGNAFYSPGSFVPSGIVDFSYDEAYKVEDDRSVIYELQEYMLDHNIVRFDIRTLFGDAESDDYEVLFRGKVRSVVMNAVNLVKQFGQPGNDQLTHVCIRCTFLMTELAALLENLKSLRVLGLRRHHPYVGSKFTTEQQQQAINKVILLLHSSTTITELSLCHSYVYKGNPEYKSRFSWKKLFRGLFDINTGNKSIKSLQLSTNARDRPLYTPEFFNSLVTNQTLTYLYLDRLDIETDLQPIIQIFQNNRTIKIMSLDTLMYDILDIINFFDALVPSIINNPVLEELVLPLMSVESDSNSPDCPYGLLSKFEKSTSLLRISFHTIIEACLTQRYTRNSSTQPFINERDQFNQYYFDLERYDKGTHSKTTNEHPSYDNDEELGYHPSITEPDLEPK